MNRARLLTPLDPALVGVIAREARLRLGSLLHANAVQAGLRLADGVHYRPRADRIAREVRCSSQLRSALRLALRQFLGLVERYPAASELPVQDWHQLAASAELWTAPELSARWAAQLLPEEFDVQLTHTVNQLRRGEARSALGDFQGELGRLSHGRDDQSTILRNSAAAYEVLGDPDAARWCAERAFRLAPWSDASLLSFLAYSLLTQSSAGILRDAGLASAAYCGAASRGQLWTMLRSMPEPLLHRLDAEAELQQRLRNTLLLQD